MAPIWLIAAAVILVLIIIAIVVLGVAMFSEMGTKRTTGTMHGGGRSSNKKNGKSGKNGKKKR